MKTHSISFIIYSVQLRFASPKLPLYKEVLKKRKPLASLDNSPDLVLPQCRGSQSRSVSGRPHHSVAKPEIATGKCDIKGKCILCSIKYILKQLELIVKCP